MLTGSLQDYSRIDQSDLFYLYDSKRLKFNIMGHYVTSDEFAEVENYLEDVVMLTGGTLELQEIKVSNEK
ncbi:MAG: hypothetical protein COA78_12045 [Blastopirellula sp.]|nr:MAG: hypothetical protein COA78_12045 [Blastopirellula sp.]